MCGLLPSFLSCLTCGAAAETEIIWFIFVTRTEDARDDRLDTLSRTDLTDKLEYLFELRPDRVDT